MAATDVWTERNVNTRPAVKSRKVFRKASRSLGAALRDAGLDDAAPDPREDRDEDLEVTADTSGFDEDSPDQTQPPEHAPLADYRSPSLSLFAAPDAPEPVTMPPLLHQSVVSPPPWLRAAKRGRNRRRLSNTFGWAMTLIVTGTIVGFASHYLAVSPKTIVSSIQARQ